MKASMYVFAVFSIACFDTGLSHETVHAKGT